MKAVCRFSRVYPSLRVTRAKEVREQTEQRETKIFFFGGREFRC